MIFNVKKEDSIKPGIYVIKNIENGKLYIGQTKKLRKRYHSHLNELVKGTHKNSYLQNEFNKHGSNAFVFEIIECCSKEELNNKEQQYIDKYYDDRNMCFNLRKDVCVVREKSFVTTYNRSEQMKQQWTNPINREKFLKATETRKDLWSDNEDRKQKLSLRTKELWHERSVELKKKIGEANKNLPKETREKVNKIVSENFSVEFTIINGTTNEVITGKNITQFCKDNNIKSRAIFSEVVHGKRKYYKTWKHVCNSLCNCKIFYDGRNHFLPSKENQIGTKKTYDIILVSPNGQNYGPFVGLQDFALEHNLATANLSALIRGKLKTCQGWKVLKNV